MFGDVYEVEYEGKRYALKREKALSKVPPPDIKFFNFIDSLSSDDQKYFTKLHQYRVVKCTHKHEFPKYAKNLLQNVPEKQKIKFEKLFKSSLCREYLMDLAGESLEKYVKKHEAKIDPKIGKRIAYSVLNIVDICNSGGWLIGDLHSGNLTITFDSPTKPKIQLIDYGDIKPMKPKQNNLDKFSTLQLLMNSGYFYIEYLSKSDVNLNIVDYISYMRKKGCLEKILEYSKKLGSDAKISKDILVGKEISKEIIDKKIGHPFVIASSILCTEEETQYWRQTTGLDIPLVPFMVPKKDLIFFMDNFNNTKKLIKYFA